jgi:hypothetical protein
MTLRTSRWRLRVGFAALLIMVGSTIPAVALKPANASIEILVLSNRADLVSGGDALLEVRVPDGRPLSALRVDVGDRNVTSAFSLRADGRVAGLVSGLAPGPNVVTAQVGQDGARLTVVNHDLGGPIFAGPQVQPWVCAPGASGPHCETPRTFSWFYRSAATGQFSAYDPENPPPAGLIASTAVDGRSVPFIIREERGSMDRGMYAIAVLADPAQPWDRWAPYEGWNGKVLWPFGEDSRTLHVQVAPDSVQDINALSNGFLVAMNSLNRHGNNTNDNVSAEAMMMLKEHIIENYGDIRHVIGQGCSGGGIQQYQISAMYPGLIDGLIPSCSFPDTLTVLVEATDCRLLENYFSQSSTPLWADPAQRAAVMGKAADGCKIWDITYANLINPSHRDNCGLPAEQVYDPMTNPKGTRCTIQDYQAAVYGLRDVDGFANRPYDNVGVQYGLVPLLAGQITPEQFVDLNVAIGGLDIDARPITQRSEADPVALVAAYRGSQVADARQWATVPIIDIRGHSTIEWHQDYNSYQARARLDAANGNHDNQVIWTGALPMAADPALVCATNMFDAAHGACTANPLLAMDQWLTRIAADNSGASLAERVRSNRPADIKDACWVAGQRIDDPVACAEAYPYYGQPRNAAGEDLAADNLKCHLKPLSREDYPVSFTAEQWSRLQAAFPTGVCDWTQPGIASQPSVPWLTYADGPVGAALGPAPASQPFRKSSEPGLTL